MFDEVKVLTIGIRGRRQVHDEVLHLLIVHHSNVVLDELQCLDGLHEMLFVQVLLIIRVVVVLLGHFGNELVQSVAWCIVLHQQWIAFCCFDSDFSLFRVVLLYLVLVLIGGWFVVLK